MCYNMVGNATSTIDKEVNPMTDINNTPEMNEEEYDVVIMTDDEGNEYV